MKKNWREKARRAMRFVKEGVWDVYPGTVSRLTRIGHRCIRICSLVFRGFQRDDCTLHASSLTFNTLMAIVPVLAISLALARGLGDPDTAKQKIKDAVYGWTETFVSETGTVHQTTSPSLPAIGMTMTNGLTSEAHQSAEAGEGFSLDTLRERINDGVDEIFNRVDNISFTALGGIGLIVLLWFVISVLGRVELSFNRVWGVQRGRSAWRKTTDYLSILLIVPVLATAASSVPIMSRLRDYAEMQGGGEFFSWWARNFATLGMTTLTFTFVLLFVPNTRVKILPGLVGGLVTALLFILWLRLCTALQIGVSRAGQIYGSFAVFPIVLAWVNISWRIVLFGAEVSYAVQNSETIKLEQGAQNPGMAAKWCLALDILTQTARAMTEGGHGIDTQHYGAERKLPERLVNQIIGILHDGGFIGELAEHEGNYVLMRAPTDIAITSILDTFMVAGRTDGVKWEPAVNPVVKRVIAAALEAHGDKLKNRNLADVLEQMMDEKGKETAV